MSNNPAIKEQLLREAETALQREGFFGVSVRQVAQNVGVHPSTVTYLFGSRAGLLKAAEGRLRACQGD
jgi:AcrR family transcriptional regulator